MTLASHQFGDEAYLDSDAIVQRQFSRLKPAIDLLLEKNVFYGETDSGELVELDECELEDEPEDLFYDRGSSSSSAPVDLSLIHI